MKCLALVCAFICATPTAFGSEVLVDSETTEIFLSLPLLLDLKCEGGREKTYPTSSALVLTSTTGFFEKSTLTSLIYDDFPRTGDHCYELMNRFLSQLPAKLTITRKLFETGNKVRRQSISGSLGDFKFESRDEY